MIKMCLMTHVALLAWHKLTAVISLSVPSGARGSVKLFDFEKVHLSRASLPRDAAVFGVRLASQTKHEPLKDKLKELLCWNSPRLLLHFEWLYYSRLGYVSLHV